MKDLRILKFLCKSKHEHFLAVDFDFFKKWKYIIRFLIFLNKNYIPCEIFRKQYKFQKSLVIVGLKWGGKNVKRRTSGLAKEYIQNTNNPICIYCENKLTMENATSDHIIPIAEGGNNTQVNIVFSCKSCNNERGTMDFNDYLKIKNPKYKGQKYIFI